MNDEEGAPAVRNCDSMGAVQAEEPPGGAVARVTKGFSALKPFIIISSSYLLFTTTDGAVRMIVLLNAYNLGFTAMEVAIMFTLYEIAGVFTNLLAGLMGAKWGIKTTLLSGLTLQLFGIGMLYGWQNDWSKREGVAYVTMAQMLCGIAKDLTKLGGKTVTKLVTPEEKQSSLFKLVSFITGFKNSLKGAGYFLGAATVAWSYYGALSVLMAMILLAMPWAVTGLSNQLGRAAKSNATLRDVFKMNYNINVLSAARLFLFGSRDAWFEVPLPFFLRNSVDGLGWARPVTGSFLAGFIIIYGQVQSWTPQLVLKPLGQSPANKYVEVLWAAALSVVPAVMAALCLGSSIFQDHHVSGMTVVMVVGLAVFCVLFAINSSVHSYLILRYAEGDKVAMNVGFYYMSNAMGRLTGTVLSGALYSFVGNSKADGLGACFVLSTVFCVICVVLTTFIRDDAAGLRCGGFFCVRPTLADDAPLDSRREQGSEEDATKAGTLDAVQSQGGAGHLDGSDTAAMDAPKSAAPVPQGMLSDSPDPNDVCLTLPEFLSGSVRHGFLSGTAEKDRSNATRAATGTGS